MISCLRFSLKYFESVTSLSPTPPHPKRQREQEKERGKKTERDTHTQTLTCMYTHTCIHTHTHLHACTHLYAYWERERERERERGTDTWFHFFITDIDVQTSFHIVLLPCVILSWLLLLSLLLFSYSEVLMQTYCLILYFMKNMWTMNKQMHR